MDTLIKNGDFSTNDNGGLVKITDELEKLQRMLFILSVEKGEFNFDRQLGSSLSNLGESTEEKLGETATEIIENALVGVEGITLESVSVNKTENNYEIEIGVYIQSRKRLVKISI